MLTPKKVGCGSQVFTLHTPLSENIVAIISPIWSSNFGFH